MKFKYFSIILLVILSSSCKDQDDSKYQIEEPTKEHGIEQKIEPYQYGPGDVVFRGYLDKTGNMWFATSNEGVFKYDGRTFTNISKDNGLCSNEVNAITQDQNGAMWFGTDKGLCTYDGDNFVHISLPREDTISVSPETGRPSRQSERVLSIIQAKNGDIWIGTDAEGAYRYDGDNFQSYLKFEGKLQPHDNKYNNCITNIIEDKNGHIWIGSFTHGGLNKFDGKKMIHHPLKDGYGDGMISTSYKDKMGNLWFGTRNSGIYKYDYQRFQNIKDEKSNEQIAMASVIEDKNGAMWIGSFARKGVYRYNNDSFVPLEINGSEKLNDIKFVSEDKDGNIWFGGRYGLLCRYDGRNLKDFTEIKRMN